MTDYEQIKRGKLPFICFDCANEIRKKENIHEPDELFTTRISTCPICNQTKQVTSARKLVGLYKRNY